MAFAAEASAFRRFDENEDFGVGQSRQLHRALHQDGSEATLHVLKLIHQTQQALGRGHDR